MRSRTAARKMGSFGLLRKRFAVAADQRLGHFDHLTSEVSDIAVGYLCSTQVEMRSDLVTNPHFLADPLKHRLQCQFFHLIIYTPLPANDQLFRETLYSVT